MAKGATWSAVSLALSFGLGLQPRPAWPQEQPLLCPAANEPLCTPEHIMDTSDGGNSVMTSQTLPGLFSSCLTGLS